MLRKFPALRAIIKRFVLILGDYIDQIFLRNNYFNKELEFFRIKKMIHFLDTMTYLLKISQVS